MPPIQTVAVHSRSFLDGVNDVFRGLGFLLRHPRLWIWAAIPFVLNVLIFAALIIFGWSWAHDLLSEHLFNREALWWAALGWLAGIVFWLVSALMIWVCFVPLATLVASPFNDLLSEFTERIYRGSMIDEAFSFKALMRGLRVGLSTSLRLAFKTMFLLLCILPLHLIPVVGNILATALSIFVSVRYLALEFTSYSMDRRYWEYEQRQAFLKLNRPRTMGLGAMACFLMAVPVLNAMFIPVSAVAGTLLFCDLSPEEE